MGSLLVEEQAKAVGTVELIPALLSGHHLCLEVTDF